MDRNIIMTSLEKLTKLTKHHIVPKSRNGGIDYNIALVTKREHQHYHALFGNRKPSEIVEYLFNTFWTPEELKK